MHNDLKPREIRRGAGLSQMALAALTADPRFVGPDRVGRPISLATIRLYESDPQAVSSSSKRVLDAIYRALVGYSFPGLASPGDAEEAMAERDLAPCYQNPDSDFHK